MGVMHRVRQIEFLLTEKKNIKNEKGRGVTLVINKYRLNTIVKRQIYAECAEFRLTCTLRGLIQQVEQSNTNLIRSQDQRRSYHNLMQINAKGRPAKRG